MRIRVILSTSSRAASRLCLVGTLAVFPTQLFAQAEQETVEEAAAEELVEAVANALADGPTGVDDTPEAAEQGLTLKLWSGHADLSLVVTEGNSTSESTGFESTIWRRGEFSKFRLRLQGTRVDSADDRFRQVAPGITWLPGETPPLDAPTVLVKPGSELDVERYLVETRFERDMPEGFGHRFPGLFRWHAGVSWDSNRDAGIIGRTIVFAGVGHTWWDFDDLRFRSNYGLSWTERNEEKPDPEKEQSFPGWRLDWDFMKKLGANDATTFEHSWVVNGNFEDSRDYSMEMINALAVSINDRFALRVSLQWLYNNEPALEDLDLVAVAVIVDPDGQPGSGDEFFQTVETGGAEVTFSETRERKEQLDTVFRTSLVLKF